MRINTLSIIIPVFNEQNTIQAILDRVREVSLRNEVQKEVIVVNDCSTDDSESEILAYKNKHPQLNIKYLKHDENKGKGAALQTGIKEATGEFLVVQDADLDTRWSETAEARVILR